MVCSGIRSDRPPQASNALLTLPPQAKPIARCAVCAVRNPLFNVVLSSSVHFHKKATSLSNLRMCGLWRLLSQAQAHGPEPRVHQMHVMRCVMPTAEGTGREGPAPQCRCHYACSGEPAEQRSL